jgi:hypothetical protein
MEAKLIATQASNSLPLNQSEIEVFPKLDSITPVLTIFGISAAIAVSTSVYIFRGWQREQSVQARDKIICDGCKYFNNNHYLQCALQPKTVMTEQSIYCQDYSPVRKVKQVEKISKVLLAIHKVFNK